MEWVPWVSGAGALITIAAMMMKVGRDSGRIEERIEALTRDASSVARKIEKHIDATASFDGRLIRIEERVAQLGELLAAAQKNNTAGG